MSKRALLIGIDKYEYFAELKGCAQDAVSMRGLLRRNADGSPNYACRLVTYTGKPDEEKITRRSLRAMLRELFNYRGPVLLYVSGHGALTPTCGYLATCDGRNDDWGIPMQDVIQMANDSKATDVLLILDCCHSGDAGNAPVFNASHNINPLALLRENMTVLAASRASELAGMQDGQSLFTAAVLDALEGGAADHLGWVTAASIYGYVDRGFGEWVQRPVYKSHATELNVIRQCAPLISRLKLQELTTLFPSPDHLYRLDPEFEPEDEHGNVHEPVNHEKIRIALLFKDYRDAGLLKASTPGKQLYWAARHSETVELTLRGREYWHLIVKDRI